MIQNGVIFSKVRLLLFAGHVYIIKFIMLLSYEDRSINKLQNGAIPLILKIGKNLK